MGRCTGHAGVFGRHAVRAGLLLECLGCTPQPSSAGTEARTPEAPGVERTSSAGASATPAVPLPSPVAAEPDITSYAVRLELDLGAHTVSGTTTLSYAARGPGPSTLRLPENGMHIESVSAQEKAVPFRIDAGTLLIELPAVDLSRASPALPPQIEIAYHATPERGLVFGPELVYTNFFTCHWMPCKEEPGDKASFRLELVVAEPLAVIASGQLVERSRAGPGRARFVWQERRPYSPYLYGFAVGLFTQTTLHAGNTELQLLGADLPADALAPRFRPTEGMLRFFESKATVPLPHTTYTQILVPGSAAQEKSSFSIIGRDELDPILSDPTEDWVIAHELAHQWWGNLVTCKDWSHFWLNEGITSFMVAAYKEQRWGFAAYERELGMFRERHQRAVDARFDVKLAFAGTYPSLGVKRAITYSKAALFLHTLRTELGDAAFWAGLGRFTREHAGQSVESRDFEHDLQAASGRDLSDLFREWVYD